MAPTPIFILCVPRSGSTLLQRILGSHEAVATASEPWFLLPGLYALREPGVRAEYGHVTLVKGLAGFAEAYLPGGLDEYLAAQRELALRLYEGAAGGKRYFLDKTPRYSHIASELMTLFPDGKFVFLWRNPLAIAASIIETYGGGKWNIKGPFSADLYRGLPNLADVYSRERKRVHAISYEQLVSEPHASVRALLDYLELPHDETLTTRFTELPMRNPEFWDPTGTVAYDSISREPLDKWRTTMATAVRRGWCKRYLERLGDGRLAMMGYDAAALRAEANELGSSPRHAFSDLLEHAKAPVRRRLGLL